MLSIIVPWRDRIELSSTIEHFSKVTEQIRGELIIVNYGGDLADFRRAYDERTLLVDVNVDGEFCKASAHNIGAKLARNQSLFFCDCDIFVEANVISGCLERVQEKNKFVTIDKVKETRPNLANDRKHILSFGYTLRILTANGRRVEIVDSEENLSSGERDAPGLLFVKKSDFEAINGYNGRFKGWGWECQDMICRLSLGIGLYRERHGTLEHLSHDDDARLKGNPEVREKWQNRDRMFRSALSRYDKEDFLGTYLQDLENHEYHVRL